MKEYLVFGIGEKTFTIKLNDIFKLKPTYINKFTKKEVEEFHCGTINYRNKTIDVYDISMIYDLPFLKKFDGLIFIHKEEKTFAIKYEGFYSYEDEISDDTIEIDLFELFFK